MMILILFILCVIGLIVIRQRRKYRANLVYWDRINNLEEQHKKEILRRTLENQ